ncbi:hypothetical protein [Luteibaculum oceani]|uniref:Uncharacterized protein n=1 Tax=Luteibaculum oceani TaxID=1294296 RepID=A0A5C6V5G1_9FLAO|nr:hypothetical protein [Luteibaculum oceani]TXC78865.1 hypothetical protein FRX97_06535 [Luteibaculum oceani]
MKYTDPSGYIIEPEAVERDPVVINNGGSHNNFGFGHRNIYNPMDSYNWYGSHGWNVSWEPTRWVPPPPPPENKDESKDKDSEVEAPTEIQNFYIGNPNANVAHLRFLLQYFEFEGGEFYITFGTKFHAEGVVQTEVERGGGNTISGIPSDISGGGSIVTTEVGLAADLTIKEMAKKAPQSLKVISKVSNGGGGVLGAFDNGIQTYNDYQNGNYGRATLNGAQGAAYLTGTVMLFTPLAPLGGAILLGTTISDWIQSGVEYGTGIENY